MAVLDQDGALGKAQECAARVLEFGRADEHRAVDVVPLARVGVDGRPAVDQGVEERKSRGDGEPLGAKLEDKERGVSSRLHVERHELRLVQRGQRPHLGRVDGDLFPRHQLDRPPRLEVDRLRAHRASARARRAQPISSTLSARSSNTLAA
jgi:hypothetical protein